MTLSVHLASSVQGYSCPGDESGRVIADCGGEFDETKTSSTPCYSAICQVTLIRSYRQPVARADCPGNFDSRQYISDKLVFPARGVIRRALLLSSSDWVTKDYSAQLLHPPELRHGTDESFDRAVPRSLHADRDRLWRPGYRRPGLMFSTPSQGAVAFACQLVLARTVCRRLLT